MKVELLVKRAPILLGHLLSLLETYSLAVFLCPVYGWLKIQKSGMFTPAYIQAKSICLAEGIRQWRTGTKRHTEDRRLD